MLRPIIFLLAIFITFASAKVELDDNDYQQNKVKVHRYRRAVHYPKHHNHERKKNRLHVATGHNAGLINLNPGHHLIIDDITLDHVLNHVVDVDLIKLKKIGKNVSILSNNQLASIS